MGSLPPISPNNLFINISYKVSPRQKAPGRPKKIRERKKQPSKIVRYLIYNRENYNRRSYTQYSPIKNKIKSSFNSSSKSSLNDNNIGEFNETRRAKLEKKARLILRIITRKKNIKIAKEDEREKQKKKNGKKFLNLGDISSDLK